MTMDQQLAVSEELSLSPEITSDTSKGVSIEESNNNVNRAEAASTTLNGNQKSNDDYQEKHNVYDVLGANDQELARHRYLDDEFDQDDEQCPDASRKKQKLNQSIKREEGALEDDDDIDSDDEDEQQSSGRNNIDDHHHHHHHHHHNHKSANGQSNGKSEEQKQQQHQDFSNNSGQSPTAEPEQMRKLFIGGLDYKTSEATLKQHFEKFGDVIDCVVMREPQSKRSRGFGFVIYASSSMVDRAQEARPHEVDGREVQPKRAISREDSGKPEAKSTVKKVYLGGLSEDIEEPELRDYFKDFGNIVNVNIVAHKDTGKRRGFAFIEFDDYDPVDKIVLKKFHTIKDKRIEAKKAIPKVEMDARKRGSDPRATLAGAMIALSGGPLDGPGGRPLRSGGRSGGGGGCALWGDGPFNGAGSYPPAYSSQTSLDGYPPHYHSPPAHYGAANWMIHEGGGGGAYGFRHGYGGGRNGYGGGSGQGANWAMDYGGGGGFSSAQGGAGPMRLSYQHRWEPYGSGYGAPRGRGYNPRS